jgi:hypothetical protein
MAKSPQFDYDLWSEQPGTRFKDASFCVKRQGAQVALPSVGSKRAMLSIDTSIN